MDLSPAHIHLMLNHIPVLGPYFLAILLAIGFFRKSREIFRTGLVLTVLFSAATYVVVLTGENAEEQIEDSTWFDEDRVHDHEERAEGSLIAAIATGALALVALWMSRKGASLKPLMEVLVLVATLVCAGMFAWTALAGGEIRHEEIRPGAPQTIDV